MKQPYCFFRGVSLSLLFIFCAVALMLSPPVAGAHTFHTSLMRMEYNEDEKLVEISVQVFAHDLEEILGRRVVMISDGLFAHDALIHII